MKFSLNWIRRFLPELTASEVDLCDALPRLGIGIEGLQHIGLPADNLVVGRILSFVPHPDADRLRLCSVDIGRTAPIQIVCGANNFQAQDLAPVALPNCSMPNGLRIQETLLRGVKSEGMMCSARELGLSDDSSGLLILPHTVQVGQPLIEIFPTTDLILDLELTANRGDCLSHLGISRELAAFYNLELVHDFLPMERVLADCLDFTERQRRESGPLITVDSDSCRSFLLWHIGGVKIGPSPKWLRDDLEAVGFRPVNNVVDVTNWIMLHVGQPLHAFDAGKVAGHQLVLRSGRAGEEFMALNHRTYSVDGETSLIVDGDGPLAIAGIMGSLRGEVDESTTEILLEAAEFTPQSIQRTARTLNLFSDASQRFARGIDPARIFQSAKDAVDLIVQVAGGEADPLPHIGKWQKRNWLLDVPSPRNATQSCRVYDRTIELSGDFVRRTFGLAITDTAIEETLKRLGFETQRQNGSWQVLVPSFRSDDVRRPIDLLEEIIRLYGVDQLPSESPTIAALSRADDPVAVFVHEAANLLRAKGFHECYSYSFTTGERLAEYFGVDMANRLALENPLNSEQSHLNGTALDGLIGVLHSNHCNGNNMNSVFEVGRIWRVTHGGEIMEAISVAWLKTIAPLQTNWRKREAPSFYDFKNTGLEIAHMANVKWKDDQFLPITIGSLWQPMHSAQAGDLERFGYLFSIGQLNLKKCRSLNFSCGLLAGELLVLPEVLRRKRKNISYQPFSNYPRVTRDLSFLMDRHLPVEGLRIQLEKCIKKALPRAVDLEGLWVIDLFQGEKVEAKKKSVSLRFQFGSRDRTLEEDEVQTIFAAIVEAARAIDFADLRDGA